jgi:arylsulfatase A-like enzyme
VGEYKPFCLWLHYMDIHEPYVPERKYIDMVDPSITISQDEMLRLFTEVLLRRDVSDWGKVKLLKKLYDIHVREVDGYIKEFFAILEKFDLLPNSVIIMTSDHGDEFGEHGGLSHDDKMYSELIDMPLLIYDLSQDEGGVCDALVSNVDIPPTIIYLFGLDPVESFEGHSLLPLGVYPEKGCFGEAMDQRSQRGGDMEKDSYFYREQDLKVIYRANLDSWEMYDLKADPKELNNIIIGTSPEAEELKIKLKPRVRRWLKDNR